MINKDDELEKLIDDFGTTTNDGVLIHNVSDLVTAILAKGYIKPKVDEEAIRKNNQLICDNKAGDCFRACLTSILCIENSPDLPNVDKESWFIDWHNFLYPKGLTLSYEKEACWKNGFWIATVKSKNFEGEFHSIIMKGQEVYFDPSPKETYEEGMNLLGKGVVNGGMSLEVSDMSKFINWAIVSQLPKILKVSNE